VIGAGLSMSRVNGGFLTNYLADLSFPPWFYIHIRGLVTNGKNIPRLAFFGNWFGLSPERSSISIFMVGVITELKTYYWPGGPLTGTYDLVDIVAYAIGLLICYAIDKWIFNSSKFQE
jgi:hypothetical protein